MNDYWSKIAFFYRNVIILQMARLHFEAADQEQVWIGDSGEPGPTAVILGGIHGSEVSGVQVIDGLRQSLSVDAGRVILVKGNPRAIETGIRQTEVNLNRQFRELTSEEQLRDPKDLPYEVRRAQELMPVLELGDSSLDIHGYSRPDGTPFIITERNGFAVAQSIGAPIISSGWAEAEPGGTDAYMYALGRIGLCYEVGWNGAPEAGRKRGLAAVSRFLGTSGLIELTGAPLDGKPRYIQTLHAVIAGEHGLDMSGAYHSFERLQPGEIIAWNGAEPIYAKENQVIIFPPDADHLRQEPGEEAFNLGQEFDLAA